jgi:hypothetical protein
VAGKVPPQLRLWRLATLPLLLAMLCVVPARTVAAETTITFDGLSPGTTVTSQYPGILFANRTEFGFPEAEYEREGVTADICGPPRILATSATQSPPNAAYLYCGGEGFGPAGTFAVLTQYAKRVSAYVGGPRSTLFRLVAYDHEGKLLGSEEVIAPPIPTAAAAAGGGIYTLIQFEAPSYEIAYFELYARYGGAEGSGMDNLSFVTAVPASASSSPATEVTPSTATLHGTLDPNSDSFTECTFQYGTSAAYGSSVPCSPKSGFGISATAASASLIELAPNTTYHYRISASNAEGTFYGGDETFTTPVGSTSATAPPEPATAIEGGLSAEASGGTGTVTVGHYGSDIGGPPLPSSDGVYVDVYRSAGATFTQIKIVDCEVGAATKIWWYDPGAGWQEASDQSYSPGPPACVTAVITASTSPSLAQLNGTRFSYSIPEPQHGTAGSSSGKSTSPSEPRKSRATVEVSTSILGATVTLSVPNKCLRNGLVEATLKLKIPSHKRKGNVVVKIYKVVFTIDHLIKTERRRHLSDAPFRLKVRIKHPRADYEYVLTARAFIAVKHGPKRTKSLHVTLKTCPSKH